MTVPHNILRVPNLGQVQRLCRTREQEQAAGVGHNPRPRLEEGGGERGETSKHEDQGQASAKCSKGTLETSTSQFRK